MNNNELIHYGILGMKWGVRRYQNKDGTLTKAGMRRAAKSERRQDRKRPKENAIVLSEKKVQKTLKKLQEQNVNYNDLKNLHGFSNKVFKTKAPHLKGKTAFEYEGKIYKYAGSYDHFPMIRDGKLIGFSGSRSVDIDIDKWNSLDDSKIKWGKIAL